MRFELVGLFGDTLLEGQSEGDLSYIRAAARLASGDVWVAQRGLIKIFRKDGGFVRSIGRPGQGPIEFNGSPGPILVDSDGLIHVFDPGNLRETVLTAEGALVRENRIPARPLHAAVLPGVDRAVVHTSIPSADRFGLPLHILDAGSPRESFGRPTVDGIMNEIEFRRRVGSDGEGRIYAMPEYAYRVEVFSDAGARLGAVIGPQLNDRLPAPGWVTMDNPPHSKVRDLWIDDHWRLWLLFEAVRSDWRDKVKETISATGEIVVHPISDDWSDVYDTRIDVIDLATLTRVATGRLDHSAFEFGGDQTFFVNQETQSGIPQLAIWRASF